MAHQAIPRWCGGVVAGLLVLGLALLTARPASAHPTLIQTQPSAGYAVAQSPPEIVVVFDEQVRLTRDGFALDGQARGNIATAPPQLSADATTITVRLPQPLPKGQYTLHWRVIGEDGHTVDGAFGFGVGTSSPTGAQSTTATSGLPVLAVARWSVLAGLTVALGGLAGEGVVRRLLTYIPVERRIPAPRPWVVTGSVLGAAGALGLAAYQLVGGNLLTGVLVEIVAFAAAALLALTYGPLLALPALLAAVVAESGLSHVGTEAPGWGAVTIGLHLTAATVWVGALLHVLRVAVAWRAAREQVRALLLSYATLAAALYVVVVATGTVAAVLVLPTPGSLVDTGYGRVLLAKLALVVLATVLALLARRSLRQLARPGTGLRPVTRAARAERGALVGVVAVTALLSSITPAPAEEVGFPPTVVEPAVRLGTLAGQITTGLVASEGAVIVRLRVPETSPTDRPDYEVEGSLLGPAGTRRQLELQPCGEGCFASPVSWSPGTNRVELTVAEANWPGGSVSFEVPWPARERAALLDRVLTRMKRQPTIEVTESISSDTSRPPAFEGQLRLSGAEFIDLQPYRSGVVSTVVQLRRSTREIEIAFAIPAEDYYIQLTVAPDSRILHSRLVSPGHLIQRTFRYPESEHS